MELENREVGEIQNKSENGVCHSIESHMKNSASDSSKIDKLNRMLTIKTEMVASLEERLSKRESEMAMKEARYQKYLRKANDISRSLMQKYGQNFLNNNSSLQSDINEKESNTENMQDETECVVCFTQYNDEEHRPRSLPCGHTLCTKCLGEAILKQSTKCPRCITQYFATNLNEIPVNYSLESVLNIISFHKNNKRNEFPEYTEHQLPKKQKVTEPTKPEIVSECVEHQLSLSNRCSTHKAWICESCLRDDHSSESCNIISLSEQLYVKKSRQISLSKSFLDKFEKTIKKSDELRKQCKEQIKERDEEITCFDIMVKRIREDIECKKESRMQLEKICNSFDQKLETLKSKRIYYDQAVISLNSSDTFKKVSQCSIELQKESEKLQLITRDIKHDINKILGAFNTPSESSIGVSLGNHSLSVRDGMYHMHAIQEKATPQTDHYCLQISDEIESAPVTDGILTFLDIAWPGQQPQRIYIKIVGNTCRARQHLLLTVGQCGHSYRGLYFQNILYKDQPGELLKICPYDGADAKPLLNDVTVNDVIAHDVKAGLVTGIALDDKTDDSNTALFAVHLRDDPGYVSSSVFGTITSGLDVLRKIAGSNEMENIKIVDCGIVLF